MGFPDGSVVKNPPVKAEDMDLIPESGRSLKRRKWQPTPVFLPGKSHEQRSVVGYNSWSYKRVRHMTRDKGPLDKIYKTEVREFYSDQKIGKHG